jgi:hypothetical protein
LELLEGKDLREAEGGMNEKERAYKLLYKLAEENDYVIVHSRELRILLQDLKLATKTLQETEIDMTGDMA